MDQNSDLKTTKIIEKGFFIKSQKSYALQLTDMAAYYIRKYEEDRLGFRANGYDRQIFPIIESLVSTEINSKVVDILEWVKRTHVQKNSGRPELG